MEYDEESESFDNEDSENYSGNNSDYEDSSVENEEDADSEKKHITKKFSIRNIPIFYCIQILKFAKIKHTSKI